MDADLFFDYREMEENRKSQPIHSVRLSKSNAKPVPLY
jgi:hypothetical protein